MRRRGGLTRRHLAERLGLSVDQIAALETGEITAGAQLRLILMRYFDCQFEDLFEVVSIEMTSET